MAPEQARNARSATISSDVYSLGAILYHCLTGQAPFEGGSALEIARQVCDSEPKRPSTFHAGLHRDLELICLKCLQKEPGERYTSARELAGDLDRWLAGEPILARPATFFETAWKWVQRHPASSALAAAAVLIFFAGLIAVSFQWRRAETALRVSRERLYAANIHLAQEAIKEQDRGRAVRLLESQLPEPGQPDLRGFEWRHLWARAQGNEDKLFPPASFDQWCLTFSPDGKFLAVGDELLDVNTGDRKRLTSDRDRPMSVVFDDAGETLVLAGNDEVKRIRVDNGSVLWRQPFKQAFRAKFLPDEATLAVTFDATSGDGYGGQACIVSATNGAILQPLAGASGRALAVSPDRSRFATGSLNGEVQVWNARSGALEQVLTNSLEVSALAFSPDGSRLVAGCWAGFLQEWDLASGKQIRESQVHHSHIWEVAYGPDGTLYTASNDNTCRAWSSDWKPSRDFTGHRSNVSCLAVSRDGNWLATTSANDVRLWNIGADASRALALKSIPYRWAPALFACGDDYVLQTLLGPSLVEARTGREIRNFGKQAIAFDVMAPDTLLLRVNDSNNPAATWNFRTGAKTNLNLERFPMQRRTLRVLSGGRIATVESNVFIWNASSGKLLRELKAIDGRTYGWNLTPDQKYIVAGGQAREGGCATLISLEDFSIKATFPTATVVEAVAINDAGTLVALGSWDHSAYLCSLPDLKLVRRLEGHRGAVYHAAFTRDNALLTASEDTSTVLWDLRSGLEMMRFPFDACFTVNDMWVLGRSGRSGDPMTLEILKAPALDDTHH
jgi:WD40 repeat protein